jgi:hypothetical protein
MRTFDDLTLDGYVSQQFDFPSLLQTKPQPVQDLFASLVVAKCVDAEIDPSAGKFCFVSIIGHSDRNDTPGLTSEQRRENERQNSELRAEAARSFVFDQIFAQIQAAGGTPPVDLASMLNVTIDAVTAGSANLIVPTPISEGQRQQNRRVQFVVSSFVP